MKRISFGANIIFLYDNLSNSITEYSFVYLMENQVLKIKRDIYRCVYMNKVLYQFDYNIFHKINL